MGFTLTEEQSILRDTLASYLADHYGFEARREAVRSAAGWRPQIWKAFADELGILGASFPEKFGGLGGGPVETMIVMEAFGEALVIEPFLGTVVIGGGVLKQSGGSQAADIIARIIKGEAILAFAHGEPQARYSLTDLRTTAVRRGSGYVLDGRKAMVVGAPWATHLIVTARTAGGRRERQGVSMFLVEADAPGLTRRDYRTIDGQRASDVQLENVAVSAEALIGPEGEGLPLLERAMDEALAAVTAEACGVLRRLYESTVDYTKQRRQFGQPVANFQVLQHRMVDMYMQLEQSISMCRMATLALTGDDEERAHAAAAAKVLVGQACTFIGQNAVQLHGGIGITDDLPLAHYFKRAIVIESQCGSTDHHLTRYEVMAFGAPSSSSTPP